MKMFEVSPSVADPDRLNEKMQSKVLAAKADSMFDDASAGMTQFSNTIGARELHTQMLKIYDCLHKMDMSWELHEWELRSNRPVIGRMITFAKKAFRKLTRWLLTPYWNQINAFHMATTLTLSEMIRLQEMLIRAEERRNSE